MDDRTKHLLAVADHLLSERDAWAGSDTPYLTADLESAVEQAIDVFSDGDIPGCCRRLNDAVSGLASEWSRFKERAASTNDPSEMPGQAFWRAVERISAERATAVERPRVSLESVKSLMEQKVSERQICVIYGWEDANGPQLWKLREELAEPGKHTGKNFVPPIERKRQEDERRRQESVAKAQNMLAAKLEAASRVAPESWETLIRQGLSAKQIATMKRCDVDEVFEKAAELGLPAPPIDYEDVRTVRSPLSPEFNESMQRNYDAQKNNRMLPAQRDESDAPKKRGRKPKAQPVEPEPEEMESVVEGTSLEDEIWEYSQGGIAPADVAEALSSPERTLTVEEVESVINRRLDAAAR